MCKEDGWETRKKCPGALNVTNRQTDASKHKVLLRAEQQLLLCQRVRRRCIPFVSDFRIAEILKNIFLNAIIGRLNTFWDIRHFQNYRSVIIAPERSAGASYSETGVSNDQVSVRCLMSVRKKRAKHRMVSAPARKTDTTRVIFQSIFKVPKKSAFARWRNDLPGP